MTNISIIIITTISLILTTIFSYPFVFDKYYGKGGMYKYPYNYIVWVLISLITGFMWLGIPVFLYYVIVFTNWIGDKIKTKQT